MRLRTFGNDSNIITVLLEVLQYLSDYDVLRLVGCVSKWLYRLSRDNSLWRTRMRRTFPKPAYQFTR